MVQPPGPYMHFVPRAGLVRHSGFLLREILFPMVVIGKDLGAGVGPVAAGVASQKMSRM